MYCLFVGNLPQVLTKTEIKQVLQVIWDNLLPEQQSCCKLH